MQELGLFFVQYCISSIRKIPYSLEYEIPGSLF
nr:MAG TPA: hypothetical protein [Caudoviricetes sp.]